MCQSISYEKKRRLFWLTYTMKNENFQSFQFFFRSVQILQKSAICILRLRIYGEKLIVKQDFKQEEN